MDHNRADRIIDTDRTNDGDDSKVKDALKRDWEQTKADMPGMDGAELDQDVDNTVRQASGKETIPPGTIPNRD